MGDGFTQAFDNQNAQNELSRLDWIRANYGEAAVARYMGMPGSQPQSPGPISQQIFNNGVSGAMNAYNSMPGVYQGISQGIGSGLQRLAAATRAQKLNAAYQQAQDEAKRQNIQRMNQVGGFNEYMYKGIPVNIGGDSPVKGNHRYKADTTPGGIAAMNDSIGAASNYAPMAGGYYGLRARSMSDVGALANQQAAGYQNLVGGYQQRERKLGGLAGAAFLQDRNDINYDFAKQQSGAMADLAGSGLSGSTTKAAIRANMAGAKARAMGNATDNAARLGLSSGMQLTGDTLGARNMSLQNAEAMAKLKMLTDQGTTGDMLKFASGVTSSYPNPYLLTQLNQQMGRGAYGGGYPGYGY